MRRILAVLTSAVLALVLVRTVANADALTFTQPHLDMASQLMLRLFGETADSTASFSAQNGDRISESPLHELAFRVPGTDSTEPQTGGGASAAPAAHIALSHLSGVDASYLARAADAGLLPAQIGFTSPSQPPAELPGETSPLFTAAYQPVAPIPKISPGPGTLAFDNPAATPPSLGVKDQQFHLNADSKDAQKGLDLNVSGQYEGSTPNDIAGLSAPAPAVPTWQLPNGNLSLGAPNFAGPNKFSLRAGLAVPVFHGLTLNLNYDAQRSSGGNILPGLENLDAENNAYVGRLTYSMPGSSNTLSISAYQNRYGQSVLPLNGYTQTGEDVNFTVKF